MEVNQAQTNLHNERIQMLIDAINLIFKNNCDANQPIFLRASDAQIISDEDKFTEAQKNNSRAIHESILQLHHENLSSPLLKVLSLCLYQITAASIDRPIKLKDLGSKSLDRFLPIVIDGVLKEPRRFKELLEQWNQNI